MIHNICKIFSGIGLVLNLALWGAGYLRVVTAHVSGEQRRFQEGGLNVKMRRLAVVTVLIVGCGCNPTYRHQIDLSGVEGFDWDGKLDIKTEYEGLFVGYRIKQIEFRHRDGHVVTLTPKFEDLTVHAEHRMDDKKAGDAVLITKWGLLPWEKSKQTIPVWLSSDQGPGSNTQATAD